jgi:hypothetical protein
LKEIGRDFRLAAVTWFTGGLTVIQALVVDLGPVLLPARSKKLGRDACRTVRRRVFTVPDGWAKYGSWIT